MTGLLDNLRRHPIWRPLHRLKQTTFGLCGYFCANVKAESFGTSKINKFDDAILHQHNVTALDISEIFKYSKITKFYNIKPTVIVLVEVLCAYNIKALNFPI
jgi:hypothetical protein